jgi:hypothetical protein
MHPKYKTPTQRDRFSDSRTHYHSNRLNWTRMANTPTQKNELELKVSGAWSITHEHGADRIFQWDKIQGILPESKPLSSRQICSVGTYHWLRPSDPVLRFSDTYYQNIRLHGQTCQQGNQIKPSSE